MLGPRCQGAGCRNKAEEGKLLCRGCRALDEMHEVRMAHWTEGRRQGRREVLKTLRDLFRSYSTVIPRHEMARFLQDWERLNDEGDGDGR